MDSEGLTVAVWAKRWLEVYKVGREHNTMRIYNNAIDVHIIPSIGHYRLRDLKAHHVQDMINKKAAKGLTRTLEIVKSTLNQMLEQAVLNEYIHKNVVKGVVLSKREKPHKRSLTDNEKQIIANADFDLKSKAFIYTLLYTGVRRGEILALSKDDVDLERKTISINKGLIFLSNQAEIKNSPKTEAGNRIIPIPDVLYDVLNSYFPTLESLHCFPANDGKLMSKTSFRRFWAKYISKLRYRF